MFRKMKQSKLLPTQEKFDTLIGATTEIYGRLVLLDSVRIDGKVVGNIETAKEKKVTVAIAEGGASAVEFEIKKIQAAAIQELSKGNNSKIIMLPSDVLSALSGTLGKIASKF